MARYSLLLLLSCYYIILTIINGADWKYLGDGPWAAREGLMGTFYNGSIWMSGGRYSPPSPQNISQSIFYNDVWKLDPSCISTPSSCHWQLVTNNTAWSGRAYHIMFNHTVNNIDYMYIIGGQNLSTFYNDVWRSTNGIQWEQVLMNNKGQFHVRAGLAAISYPADGHIYLSSGCHDEFPNRKELNDIWRSKDGSEWELIVENNENILMHVRSGPRIQIYDDILYIVAGEYGFSETTQLGDIWKIDLTTIDVNNASNNAWDMIIDKAPFVNRSGHGFVIDNHGTFWVIAGYYDLHDLWKSSDLGVSWNRVDREVFNCKLDEIHCGRYDFWAQLDDKDNLFLYGGDSSYSTFGGEWNQTFVNNLDTYQ